jgi:asparagine synthase (glutamine-hydrolysing)
VSSLAVVVYKNGKAADRHCAGSMIAAIPMRAAPHVAIAVDGSFAAAVGQTLWARDGVTHEDGIIAVLSGRIDNREDLRTAVGLPTTADDCRILLAAYRRWGVNCAEHLDGDFAWVIWDRALGRLLAARDLLGVRPLYYHETPQAIHLSSHPAAIVAVCPAAGAVQDETILVTYAAGYVDNGERTLYPGILRLMGGHRLTFTAAGCTVARFASWSSETRPPGQDAPERFAELLDSAVRRRMVSAAPVASLLSGGLDSSSVVAMAQRHAERIGEAPLRTYSQVFPNSSDGDERPFIMAMVGEGGLDPKFLDCSGIAAFDGLDRALAVQAGPFIGPNFATTVHTYQRAARDGYGVLLDGHGGDEAVSSGLASLFDHAYTLRLGPLWRNVRALSRMNGMRPAQLMVNLLRKRGPHTGRAQRAKALIGQPRPDWLGPAVTWPATKPRLPQPGRESFTEHLDLLTSPFFVQALELLAHASAGEGIELRFPLLDRDLIAWCLAAPGGEKFVEGFPRALLRNGMVGYLPDQVRYRRDKYDFTTHVIQGMTRADQGVVEEVLVDRNSYLKPFFNMPILRERWQALNDPSRPVDGYSIQAIWRAIVLGRWLQLHR